MVRTKVKSRRLLSLRQFPKHLLPETQRNPSMDSPPRMTVTQRDQFMVEQRVFQIYQIFSELPHNSKLELQRDSHIEYLISGLRGLSFAFSSLDANRPWLCYWILHSLALLDESIDADLENSTIDFLRRCQMDFHSTIQKFLIEIVDSNCIKITEDPNGGYGGGPGQMPHLATTYAAVNSLISVGGHGSLSSINRHSIRSFLGQMKQPNGGFRMHDGGEVDVRACYTAISVASILNILDAELVQNVGDYILSCQSHEGGIAAEPGSEAHGGYTFCGVASMILINEVDRLNLAGLLDWVLFRQGVECGFQGRINKLVDGCYSFWQGGVCALLQRLSPIINRQLGLPEAKDDNDDDSTDTPLSVTSDISEGEHNLDNTSRADEIHEFREEGTQSTSYPVSLSNVGHNFLELPEKGSPHFNSIALQQYILLCSQLQEGGFRDKPGKGRDFYHTCYCLSGLSACQWSSSTDIDSPPVPRDVLGPYSNLLEPIHPVYNLVLSKYQEAYEFFRSP